MSVTEFREQDLTDEQLAFEVTHTKPGWPRVENFP
jgi:hypothetical protein